MDYKEEFLQISKLLDTFSHLWNYEVINHYPESLKAYENEWLEELAKLSDDELFRIDSNRDLSGLCAGKFQKLLNGIYAASAINEQGPKKIPSLKINAYTRVKPKKKHEIDSLIPLLLKVKKESNFQNMVDICGGMGHLSRIASAYFNIDSICLDHDDLLIKVGKKIIKKHHPEILENDKFKFHKADFINKKISSLDPTKSLISEFSFLVGLHTCGPLALKLFETAFHYNTLGFINVGCCYSKLNQETEINLSKIAKKNPLNISQEGLTLATRSHANITKKEYQLKKRVKFYRYALHLLLYEKLDIIDFFGVGNSTAELYYGDFATYANDNFKKSKIDHSFSTTSLNNFFNDQKRHRLINKMFLSNIIRWQFGRLLEKYILLDRVLFWEEQGYTVKMQEIFDQNISPRNIAIIAQKI